MSSLKFADIQTLYMVCIALLIIFAASLVYIKKKQIPVSPIGLFLKALVIILVSIVLAKPYLEKISESSKATLLLDISESMDEGLADQLLTKIKSFKEQGIDIDIYPFAGDTAQIGSSLAEASKFRKVKTAWSKLDIGTTNLAKALEQTINTSQSSILLISDAYLTKGSLDDISALIDTSSSKIFPFLPPNAAITSSAFRVSNLHAPLIAPAKKSVEIRVSIANTTNSSQAGLVEVIHDKQSVLSQEVEVKAGEEILVLAESNPSTEGIKEITAKLSPKNNTLPQSSQTIYLSGEERERVILLSNNENEEKILKSILEEQSYRLESVIPKDTNNDFPEFGKASVVIFNNLPISLLPDGTLGALDRYIKDGGNFIMLGGNKSFGLGGYLKTQMEEILPVRMLPPQTVKKRLNVGVILVLDKSRSMSFGSKLDFAKDAAREVVRNLKDQDYIGVIGFDSTPFIAIPIMPIKDNRELAYNRIGRIFPAGKTNLFPAIDEARRALKRIKAGRKHMIILTDGKIPDAGPYYIELVRQMRLLGITVSTVMMGSEADISLLREMAEVGGGAFYQTTNARNLPRIFLSDIKVSTGERTLKEKLEYVVKLGTHPLPNTEIRSFPPLQGYVQTAPKSKAELYLILAALGKAEPLLAAWQYGKGRSVAYTSDANGRWSNYWVRWPKFRKFWTDMIDWLRPDENEDQEKIKFELRYFVEHGKLTLDLSIYSETASGAISAKLVNPANIEKSIDFVNISRGHFAAHVDNIMAGKYELRAQMGQKDLTPVAFYLSGELFGEKKGQGFNVPLLQSLASNSGGIINPEAKDIKSQVYKNIEKNDISHLCLALALVLLCLEILRREVIARYSPWSLIFRFIGR